MEITAKVLETSFVTTDGLPAYREHNNGPILQINVVTPDTGTSTPFSVAQVRLQGVIRSRIGDRTSIQKVLNVVEYCSWPHFVPLYARSHATSTTYTANLGFDLSEKAAACTVLPSTTISGSAHITEHTALNDRRHVQGSCNTYCWIDVDLFKDGTLIQQHQQEIRFECYPNHLSLSPSKGHESGLSVICRPPKTLIRSGIRAGSTSKALPLVQISIAAVDQPLASQTLGTSERFTTVDVPLEACFKQMPPAVFDDAEAAGGLHCEVEAKWYTKRTFAVASGEHTKADRVEIMTQLASSQMSAVNFPPLISAISEADSHNPVSAVGMLRLILPASASMPTTETDLLKITYELDLKYTLYLDGRKQRLLLKGKTRLNCNLM